MSENEEPIVPGPSTPLERGAAAMEITPEQWAMEAFGECPRCKVRTLGKSPSVSRADRKTRVCNTCGQDESMIDYKFSVGFITEAERDAEMTGWLEEAR